MSDGQTLVIRPQAGGVLHRARELLPRGGGLETEDWNRRHRGLLAILWLHVVAVPVFGVLQGYGVLHSILEGSLIATAGTLGTWAPVSRTLRAAAVSVGLLTASALLVHFSGGYIEFHFHFFVMIGLLSLYQHWLPFLAAVAYVGLHHGVAGVLDPETVYNHPAAVEHPVRWAGIHAGFVLAAGMANVFAWRLSEQEQRRRRNLERVTEAALAHLPLAELLDEVLARVREVLEADVATIALREQRDGPLTIRATHGAAPPPDAALTSQERGVVGRIIATSAARVVESADPDQLDNPVHRAAGVHSIAGVALVVEGTAIGVLDVGSRQARRFTDQEVALLQLVADRIAPAIDRARLHEREHRIAETLQLSLLPKELPVVAGVAIGFRYRPSGQGAAVGGDWYDAVLLPGGLIGVAIGDVVGHGIDAASLMGQLRTGLRAYALEGHGPQDVVTRLDELTCGLGEGNMATLLYLELCPETGALAYVSAGHPPPVVRSADGETARFESPSGTPLGAGIGPPYREVHRTLAHGSTMVLYTDGLVESRVTGVDEGLDRLQRVVATRGDIDIEELCELLLSRVPPPDGTADDAALLVLRLAASLGSVLDLEYPAEPRSAATLRRTLERWLDEGEIVEADAHAIVTASNEAAANAIEHAYGAETASFRLFAERRDGEIAVTIGDTGRWQPSRGTGRGRGLTLMQALMDDVDLERSAAGTTVRMRKRLERARFATAR